MWRGSAASQGGFAKVGILTWLTLLWVPLGGTAQIPKGYFYAVGGSVVVPQSAYTRWNGDFVQVGGGGEGRVTERFALGADVMVLLPVNNQYALTTGVLSFTPAYHFARSDAKSKLDPFVGGGLSGIIGRGGGAVALHYGGGANYWLNRRLGLRFEFRHHIWSPEGGETINVVGLRAGITFSLP
jgi:hypothetical protein